MIFNDLLLFNSWPLWCHTIINYENAVLKESKRRLLKKFSAVSRPVVFCLDREQNRLLAIGYRLLALKLEQNSGQNREVINHWISENTWKHDWAPPITPDRGRYVMIYCLHALWFSIHCCTLATISTALHSVIYNTLVRCFSHIWENRLLTQIHSGQI